MTDFSITIRPATLADAVPAVALIRLSMGDEVDWLFGQETSHLTDKVLEALYLREANRVSHDLCWLAELDGQVVGLLLAFPGRKLRRLELRTALHLIRVIGLSATVGVARRQPIYGDLVEAESDEFYISNIAVSPAMQGHGIGAYLLSFTEDLAHNSGLPKCSLIVTFDNPARRLYEHCGYELVRSYEITHPVIAHGSGGFHRMVKYLGNPSSV